MKRRTLKTKRTVKRKTVKKSVKVYKKKATPRKSRKVTKRVVKKRSRASPKLSEDYGSEYFVLGSKIPKEFHQYDLPSAIYEPSLPLRTSRYEGSAHGNSPKGGCSSGTCSLK